ncbi:6134_t:CDS:1, partial [Ambispora leptoticha]
LQQDKYEENEQHFTCIFPSDWNNGTRVPCNAFAETTAGNGNADSLQITKYFPTTLHVNYRVWNTAQVKKIGQGNFEADWPDRQVSGDAPSKQCSIILWMHHTYVTFEHQEAAQKLFENFKFQFYYIKTGEFHEIKQEFYRLQKEANMLQA